MKIKTGDNVIVLSGKSRGTKGKVARSFPTLGKVIVEGANIAKRRQRPRKQGEKGQVIERAMPLAISAVAFYCSHCGKGTRVGYKLEAGKKVRVCRGCEREI
jgi:large subunit ribosomal protein L24